MKKSCADNAIQMPNPNINYLQGLLLGNQIKDVSSMQELNTSGQGSEESKHYENEKENISPNISQSSGNNTTNNGNNSGKVSQTVDMTEHDEIHSCTNPGNIKDTQFKSKEHLPPSRKKKVACKGRKQDVPQTPRFNYGALQSSQNYVEKEDSKMSDEQVSDSDLPSFGGFAPPNLAKQPEIVQTREESTGNDSTNPVYINPESLEEIQKTVEPTSEPRQTRKTRRKAAEQRAAEQKIAEQKAAHQAAVEQLADQIAAEIRLTKQKPVQQKPVQQEPDQQKPDLQKPDQQETNQQEPAHQNPAHQDTSQQDTSQQEAAPLRPYKGIPAVMLPDDSSSEEEEETIETETTPKVSQPSSVKQTTSTLAKMSISPYLVTQVRVAHNDDDESVKCEICMNGDTTEEEEILLCDLCNGAVHQSCYGRDIEYNIPDGDWFCERCNEIVATKKIPKCTLCGGLKGVMVQTDRLKWVHPICVNWMPGIYFFDAEVGKTPHMYKVGGNIDKDLVSSKCKYCGKSSGTCITCEYKNCTAHFHVYCSAMKGCIKDYQDANELSQVENHGYCPVFCTQHETLGTKTFKEHGYKGIKAAEHPVQSEEKIRLKVSKLKKHERSSRLSTKNKAKKRNMKCRMKMNEDDDEEYQLGSESLSANINQEYEISETIPKKKKAKKNSKKRVRKAPPSKKQGATEIDVLQKLKSLVSNSTQLGNSSGQQNESMGVSQLKDLLNKIKIPLMSNASNNNSQKQTKAPAKNKKQSKTKKQVQIKQVMRTPMTRGKTRNKTPQNVSNPPQNVSKPQKQQNSNPTPKVPCSKTKVYTVKPGLAQLLSIESGTIKEISLKFINYALENGLVNHSSSTYMIFKDHQLRIIFGVDIIKTNELINILYNSHVIKEDEAGTAGSDEMNPMEKKRSEIVEKLLQG